MVEYQQLISLSEFDNVCVALRGIQNNQYQANMIVADYAQRKHSFIEFYQRVNGSKSGCMDLVIC